MKRAVLVLALAACRGQSQPEQTGVNPTLEPVTSPATSPPKSGEDTAGYVGVLTPRGSAEVLAPFTSTVAELSIKLGDRVEKGQKLGRLDDRPLREELAIAKATLRATQAEASQAEIERRAAHAGLDREQRALKENVVSQAEVSAAEFNDRKATMAVARAAASVEEQRAKIAKLQARLVDTTLLAPLAGKLALAYVQAGDRVEEGHPVVRVISSDELFVKFAIPADRVGTLTPGSEIDVLIESQAIKTRAIVRHVAPELDPVAQMIVADADLVAPPAQLQSGIVCRIVPHAAKEPPR